MKIAAASHNLLQRVNEFIIPVVIYILTDWDNIRDRGPPCNAAEYMRVA
jgi:hypothetical protein